MSDFRECEDCGRVAVYGFGAYRCTCGSPDTARVEEASPDDPPLVVTYTNHEGVTAVRRIIPLAAPFFDTTEHHPEPGWLMRVWDVDKQAERTFSLQDMYGTPADPLRESTPHPRLRDDEGGRVRAKHGRGED